MADSAPANKWTFLTGLATAALPLVTALVIGGGGVLGFQHITKKPEPIPAADPPRPVPMVAIADLEHMLAPYGDKLEALRKLVEERIPAPAPRMAPSKVRVFK